MKVEVNLLQMDNKTVTMTIQDFKKIIKLAEIGKATEKALNSNSNSFITIYQYTKDVQYFNTIEELLEWAESED